MDATLSPPARLEALAASVRYPDEAAALRFLAIQFPRAASFIHQPYRDECMDWDRLSEAPGLSQGERRAVRVALALLNTVNELNMDDLAMGCSAASLAIVVSYISQGRLTVVSAQD